MPAENPAPFITRYRKPLIVTGASLVAVLLTAGVLFTVFYLRYAHQIDSRLADGAFRDSANIYASTMKVETGDRLSEPELLDELRLAGLPAGSWKVTGDRVEILPAGATVSFGKTEISRIELHGKEAPDLSLGAPLMATVSAGREQRKLVRFAEIPPVLVQATISAEDRHFFQHQGLDLPRVLKAAFVDVKDGRKAEGASTLTMQLVRGLWLDPDKHWKRKAVEALMAVHLEQRWSKEEIFETYANQIYLGRQAAYSIHGFGQGANLFFGKPLGELTLPEAALLAGLIQRPSYFNPSRSPAHAKQRRDLVLGLMRRNRYITAAQYEAAKATPVAVLDGARNISRAPYFLDLVNDEIQSRQDQETPRDVYTTLDLGLQHDADEAVAAGMAEVDKLLAKRNDKSGAHAEVALLAIDPHTGEIKAMVGGRDYERSQLNHVQSLRPPGSVFKPFVYAAALNSGVVGGETVYTAASLVDDAPTTFWFGGKPYEPANFKHETFGTLSFRQALAKSDNVAAVKVAEEVGYGSVVSMAQRAGLNSEIQATPAVALGAYQVTPLEMAGAYTMFANGGQWVKPSLISHMNGNDGDNISMPPPLTRAALDPRVAYLMVSMLQEVMRTGTAAGVRSRGFVLPAAGKTGTSHDGWFVGFTGKLLCVVWVGFDDYRELNLEGAKSALPVWTEFMKRASRRHAYRETKDFPVVSGVGQAHICTASGKLAGDLCSDVRDEWFISGTQPTEICTMHSVPETVIAGSIF